MRSRPSWQPICNKMGNLQNKLNVLLNEAIELDKRLLSALPKSILQEAIQGKLVPQDTTEEHASTLLQKIRDEKNRLVVEGKLKKKDLTDSIIFKGDDNKYYENNSGKISCIDDEIPFEIPSSWVWARLDNICSFIHRGKSPKYLSLIHISEPTRPY